MVRLWVRKTCEGGPWQIIDLQFFQSLVYILHQNFAEIYNYKIG